MTVCGKVFFTLFVCSVYSACPACPDRQVRSFILPGTLIGEADIKLWASGQSFGAQVPRALGRLWAASSQNRQRLDIIRDIVSTVHAAR